MRSILVSSKTLLVSVVVLLCAVVWIPCSSFTIPAPIQVRVRARVRVGLSPPSPPSLLQHDNNNNNLHDNVNHYSNLRTMLAAAAAASPPPDDDNNFPNNMPPPRTKSNNSNNNNNNNSPSSSSSSSSGYFIQPDQLDQIRQSADIVSVIESYNLPKFRRTGDYQATCLCPFHDDNNPSMSIDSQRGIYKCFSCGAGGNVFHFVQEYSKIIEGGEENGLSFFQTVKLVNDKFAGGLAISLLGREGGGGGKGNNSERWAKRERVLQANLEASKFYEQALTSLPAGVARAHLRGRGLTGNTVRAFSIGFAPESYFTGKQTGYRRWGDGSLVNHLRDHGFTPDEIIDAGLAIRTKRGKLEAANSTDYTTLMDRFRGRLLVPIFDRTGNNVLGFGGRQLDLPSAEQQATNFSAPKYLNSPESVVFQKKHILFGRHMAQRAIRSAQLKGDLTRPVVIVEGYMDAIALWQAGIREAVACMGTALTQEQLVASAGVLGNTPNGRVILCLDNDKAGAGAIERLCGGSILSSVAEQCSVEFRIAVLPDGIKDPAEFVEHSSEPEGVEERFRSEVLESSIEWTQWYVNHIVSEYDGVSARGSTGSFGSIFDRLAEFLAGFPNAAERTKRAVELGSTLAKILAKETNTTTPSKTVQIQLESDLVEKASAIANERDAISKRLSFLEGGSEMDMKTKLANIARGDGSSGIDEGAMTRWKKPKRTTSSNSEKTEEDPWATSKEMEYLEDEYGANWSGPEPTRAHSTRKFRPRKNGSRKIKAPALTEHFSGFEFDDNDARWLDLIDAKGKSNPDALLLDNMRNDFGELNELKQKKVVYFNSNEYHGNQFITDVAREAGYKSRPVKRSADMFEKGVATLISKDNDFALVSAENALLRVLVRYASARNAVMNMIETHLALGSDDMDTVLWSSPEKEWLFSALTSRKNQLPPNIVGPEDIEKLRVHLLGSADFFPKAISPAPPLDDTNTNVTSLQVAVVADEAIHEVDDEAINDASLENVIMAEPVVPIDTEAALVSSAPSSADGEVLQPEASTAGTLNYIFVEEENLTELALTSSVPPEERAELEAQDQFSALVLFSAKKGLSERIAYLADATTLIYGQNESPEDAPAFESEENKGGAIVPVGPGSFLLSDRNITVSTDGLKDLCSKVSTEIQSNIKKIQSLSDARRRLQKRIVEGVSRDSAFAIQQASYDKLCNNLKQHMKELDQWSAPLPPGGLDEREEPYEDFLERLRHEWGDLYEDDRMWNIDDVVDGIPNADFNMDHLLKDSADDETESVEEFEERMQRDWGWLEDEEEEKQEQQPVIDTIDFSEFQLGPTQDVS